MVQVTVAPLEVRPLVAIAEITGGVVSGAGCADLKHVDYWLAAIVHDCRDKIRPVAGS